MLLVLLISHEVVLLCVLCLLYVCYSVGSDLLTRSVTLYQTYPTMLMPVHISLTLMCTETG